MKTHFRRFRASWPMRLPRWAFLVSVMLLGQCPSQADADVADVFRALRPSLALIVSGDSSGTAFCIASNGRESYYLTDLHVVGDTNSATLYQQYPAVVKMSGTVVARGSLSADVDLAVVRVARGNIPTVRLRSVSSREGEPVALAGYPSSQFTIAKIGYGLVPSMHVGSISAILAGGRVIQYDAETLPGNSGGPVFSTSTGEVVGVVRAKVKGFTEINLATAVATTALPFVAEHGIAIGSATVAAAGNETRAPTASSGDAILPDALLAAPHRYDGKEVRVEGTIRRVEYRRSASGNAYVVLDLCGMSCIHVFAFGDPSITEGRRAVIRGTFAAFKRVGSYNFYNELDADDNAF